MHIVIASHALPWHRSGGLERATWSMLLGLAERGHRVTVLTTPLRRTQADEFGVPAGARVWLQPPGTENLPGRVELKFLGGRPGHPSPGFWRPVARELKRLWRRGEADVLVAVDTAAMLLRGVPFVLQLHGTLFSETTLHRGFQDFRGEFPLLHSAWRYKARLLSWPLFGPMVRRAALVLIDSDFIRRELDRTHPRLGQRLETIPLALDPGWAGQLAGGPDAAEEPARAESFSAERPMRLLSVGRLARIKGHDVVAEALGELIAGGRPHLSWEIAGPDPDVALDLPSLETGKELRGLLNPLGRLSSPDLAKAFRRADYFLNVEYNQPAFGLVALEAMTAGTAPIVSDRGALPEVVSVSGKSYGEVDARSQPGFVIPAGDARALTQRLEQLYDGGPSLAHRHAGAARSRSRDFSFDLYVDRLESALRRAAGLRRR